MRTKRPLSIVRTLLIGLVIIMFTVAAWPAALARAASQDPIAHDPTMIKEGSYYYVFITGDASKPNTYLPVKRSTDLVTWTELGPVFTTPPAWIAEQLGVAPPAFWAPDINYIHGQYYLYYAASSFGTNNSVIGLATNATLDPGNPAYHWVDHGMVIRSYTTDNFNAIDPNVSFDGNGVPWLAFGSFWDGIKMRQLDAKTGLLSTIDTTLYSLASRGGGAIEGASITRHGDYFYLFVSFDFCCRGVNSDYRTMVGRASAITGPYYDENGTSMLAGGGTELMRSYNKFRGPGGGDVYFHAGTYWYAHHYYDATDNGAPKLSVRKIMWNNGWPILSDPLSGNDGLGHGTAYFAIVNQSSPLVADNAGCGYEGANIQLWTWLQNSCQQWRPDYNDGAYSGILNRFSNKVFDVTACGTADGTNIAQWGWLANDCQKWQFLTTTGGWLRIVNKNSGKVAAAPDPCQQPGANIELLSWTGTACQQFRIQPVGDVVLVNANSGKALDAAACNGVGGDAIQQSARTAQCQQWTFTHTDNGYYTVTNRRLGQELAIAQCTGNGNKAVLRKDATGTRACDQWQLKPLNDGTFSLVNRTTGKVLEVAGCSTADTALVQQSLWLNTMCQRFKVVLP